MQSSFHYPGLNSESPHLKFFLLHKQKCHWKWVPFTSPSRSWWWCNFCNSALCRTGSYRSIPNHLWPSHQVYSFLCHSYHDSSDPEDRKALTQLPNVTWAQQQQACLDLAGPPSKTTLHTPQSWKAGKLRLHSATATHTSPGQLALTLSDLICYTSKCQEAWASHTNWHCGSQRAQPGSTTRREAIRTSQIQPGSRALLCLGHRHNKLTQAPALQRYRRCHGSCSTCAHTAGATALKGQMLCSTATTQQHLYGLLISRLVLCCWAEVFLLFVSFRRGFVCLADCCFHFKQN